MSRALLDVNALIALFDEDHPFNAAARRWWVSWNGDWATCPLTQNGFLRILSQPGYANPMPMAEAMDLLEIAISQENHTFWPDDLSIADPAVFNHTRILGPRQLTDIYLLALAVKNGGRLVTFDRTIPVAAVRGATPENLVVL